MGSPGSAGRWEFARDVQLRQAAFQPTRWTPSRVVALSLHLLTSPMALPPARTYPIVAADQSSPLSVGPSATFFSWRRSVGMLLAAIVVVYAAATMARIVARNTTCFYRVISVGP